MTFISLVRKQQPTKKNMPPSVQVLLKRIVKLFCTILDSLSAEGETREEWGGEAAADDIHYKLYNIQNLIIEVRDNPSSEKGVDVKKLEKLQEDCDWFIAKLISRGYNIKNAWKRHIGKCQHTRVPTGSM